MEPIDALKDVNPAEVTSVVKWVIGSLVSIVVVLGAVIAYLHKVSINAKNEQIKSLTKLVAEKDVQLTEWHNIVTEKVIPVLATVNKTMELVMQRLTKTD